MTRARKLRSPLKGPPLRVPGQSVQQEIDNLVWDGFASFAVFACVLSVLAGVEWLAVLRHLPRQPWTFTALALISIIYAVYRFIHTRDRLEPLKLGRDGELVVGQYLEQLRAEHAAQILHDVPGEGFNLDHVVLSTHGFYAVETKTNSKPPRGTPVVQLNASGLTLNGLTPDRDPLVQAKAGARWLAQLLEESTGKRFAVRGVVLYPGWFVEPMNESWLSSDQPWVLAPRSFMAFISGSSRRINESDVKLAAFHLSRYVRAKARTAL